MRFLLDHSIPAALAGAIRVLVEADGEDELHYLAEFYPGDTPDDDWLRGIARDHPDMIVVTADARIAKSPQRIEAWLDAGLTTFFLKSFAHHRLWDQAAKLVKWWPDIHDAADDASRGDGFMVSAHGDVEPYQPKRR